MKNKMIEMAESEMQSINGGDGAAYGGILATAGIAAVGGAFVLVAGPVFLIGLAVVGAAAAVEGAYVAYNA